MCLCYRIAYTRVAELHRVVEVLLWYRTFPLILENVQRLCKDERNVVLGQCITQVITPYFSVQASNAPLKPVHVPMLTDLILKYCPTEMIYSILYLEELAVSAMRLKELIAELLLVRCLMSRAMSCTRMHVQHAHVTCVHVHMHPEICTHIHTTVTLACAWQWEQDCALDDFDELVFESNFQADGEAFFDLEFKNDCQDEAGDLFVSTIQTPVAVGAEHAVTK